MNDIEALVFDAVKKAVKASYPNININSIEDYSPEEFPSVQVYMANASTDKSGIDSAGFEKFTNVMFEASIYTEGSTRKFTAKSIFKLIDNKMKLLGFTRQDYATIVFDRTKLRIVARYEAKVGIQGSDFIIYRR